jgi:hypothetical protein
MHRRATALTARVLVSETVSVTRAVVLTLILAIPIGLCVAVAWPADSLWAFGLIFGLIGALLTLAVLHAWYMALFGGHAEISVPDFILPMGVELPSTVRFGRALPRRLMDQVHIDIRIEERQDLESSFGTLWKQRFPITMSTRTSGQLRFALPHDMPASHGSARIHATLSLHAGFRSWSFPLSTRVAQPDEIRFGLQDTAQLGHQYAETSSEQAQRNRRRLSLGVAVFVVVLTALQIAWNALQR